MEGVFILDVEAKVDGSTKEDVGPSSFLGTCGIL